MGVIIGRRDVTKPIVIEALPLYATRSIDRGHRVLDTVQQRHRQMVVPRIVCNLRYAIRVVIIDATVDRLCAVWPRCRTTVIPTRVVDVPRVASIVVREDVVG